MREQALDAQLAKKKRVEDLRNGITATSGSQVEKLENRNLSTGELMMFVGAVFALMFAMGAGVIYTVVKVVGDQ